MTHDELPLLSKSRFAAGLQCDKRLFLECYSPELADSVDPAQQALFEAGSAVGVLARKRFPGGRLIDVPYWEHDRAVEATGEALADRSLPSVYEAGFIFDDVRIRADVLARGSRGRFDLVEVKSSTKVREEHIADAAIQLYVVEGAGVRVRGVFLLHIDSGYVYPGGDYDVACLFGLEDVTREARRFVRSAVPKALSGMRRGLSRDEAPEVEIGPHCARPYQCPFYSYCRRDAPEHHVEQLPWAGAKLLAKLLEEGVRDIRHIPYGFPGLSLLQERVRDSVMSGRPHIEPALAVALGRVSYPLHFLDFETVGPALPLYPGTRPYQTIPFQWSLHVCDRGGDLRHRAFLADGDGDPRESFVASLLDAVAAEGTIVAYSSYEQRIIRQLASDLPHYADGLMGLDDRFLDLLEVLRAHYYHPDLHGSFSLKSVLPVVVPEVGYEDLEIRDGAQAAMAFQRLASPEAADEEKERLREALLSYCQRDTEAMVRIYDALR